VFVRTWQGIQWGQVDWIKQGVLAKRIIIRWGVGT
jgi:hypothetical protein